VLLCFISTDAGGIQGIEGFENLTPGVTASKLFPPTSTCHRRATPGCAKTGLFLSFVRRRRRRRRRRRNVYSKPELTQ